MCSKKDSTMENNSVILETIKFDFCVAIKKCLNRFKEYGYYKNVFDHHPELFTDFSQKLFDYMQNQLTEMDNATVLRCQPVEIDRSIMNDGDETLDIVLHELIKTESVWDDDSNANQELNDNNDNPPSMTVVAIKQDKDDRNDLPNHISNDIVVDTVAVKIEHPDSPSNNQLVSPSLTDGDEDFSFSEIPIYNQSNAVEIFPLNNGKDDDQEKNIMGSDNNDSTESQSVDDSNMDIDITPIVPFWDTTADIVITEKAGLSKSTVSGARNFNQSFSPTASFENIPATSSTANTAIRQETNLFTSDEKGSAHNTTIIHKSVFSRVDSNLKHSPIESVNLPLIGSESANKIITESIFIEVIADDENIQQMYSSFDPDDDTTLNRELAHKLLNIPGDQLQQLFDCENSIWKIQTINDVRRSNVSENHNNNTLDDAEENDEDYVSNSEENGEIERPVTPNHNIGNRSDVATVIEDVTTNGTRKELIRRALKGGEATTPPIRIQTSKDGPKKYKCGMCAVEVCKPARHYLTVHKSDERVQKILSLKPNDPLRKVMLEYLRKEGEFKENRFGTDENRHRRLVRRPNPNKIRDVSDILFCTNCLGSYPTNYFSLHWKRCTGKETHGRRTLKQAARRLEDDCHFRVSKKLRHILSKLDHDVVGKTAKLDDLIIIYGNLLATQYKPGHNYSMIRQRLRILARLLLAAKNINKNITNLKSIFHPEYFDVCLDAVNDVAGLNANGTHYKAPATAAALRTLLYTVSNVLQCEYIKEKETEKKDEVTDFVKLMKRSWNTQISKTVRETQEKNRRLREVELPPIADVVCLINYLKEERKKKFDELQYNFSYGNWLVLSEVTFLILQIFNQRCAGKTERMGIDDYSNIEEISETIHLDIFQKLSDDEKKICRKYKVVQLRGKLVRTAFLLLDEEMRNSIELIIKYREKAGVHPKNRFVFALPGPVDYKSGYLRACQLIRKYSVDCGAVNPLLLRGTKLRKHFATNLNSSNYNNTRRSTTDAHLGHDITFHKKFYQLQDIAREIMQVSTILKSGCGSFTPDLVDNDSESSDYGSELEISPPLNAEINAKNSPTSIPNLAGSSTSETTPGTGETEPSRSRTIRDNEMQLSSVKSENIENESIDANLDSYKNKDVSEEDAIAPVKDNQSTGRRVSRRLKRKFDHTNDDANEKLSQKNDIVEKKKKKSYCPSNKKQENY